jgi:response regulator of citrate/malate metabolism
MAPVPTKKKPPASEPARILLVDDEPALLELVEDMAHRALPCTVLRASNLSQATRILETQTIELMIADVHLPDGDGMSLLETLHLHQPGASAMIMTGDPSVDRAIAALRHGAVDFLPKPFNYENITERLRQALDRQSKDARREKRVDRLKVAVRRLGEARRVVSKKVDLLCNDLVTAYSELSKQFDGVRHQEGFRKYIAQAHDLEQLLCHAMDWLMRQLGYSNVAIWLAADDGEFQLGAYMKYTLAGERLLTDALNRVVLPVAVRDGVLHTRAQNLAARFTPQELSMLAGHDLLAVNCTYLGESLAAIMFFRDGKSPFTADDQTLLRAISPIFAIALASMVRGGFTEGAEGESGNNPFLPGDTLEEDQDKPRRDRDSADWWKKGEPPPF